MEIVETSLALSVLGQGLPGVEYRQGQHTVTMARMPSGTLRMLCKYCRGGGAYVLPPVVERITGRKTCQACHGEGLWGEFTERSALEAAERYLRRKSLSRAELRRELFAEAEQWHADNAELFAAVVRAAPESTYLRRLLRQLRLTGEVWTPAQMRAVKEILAAVDNPQNLTHVGVIGQRLEFTGILSYTRLAYRGYTAAYMLVIDGDGDFQGARFVVWSTGAVASSLYGMDGEWLRASAVITDHVLQLGQPQNRATRLKLLERSTERGVDRSGWPGLLEFAPGAVPTSLPVRDARHAHALLRVLFTNPHYGLPLTATLSWNGTDRHTFRADDVLGPDPAGAYTALAADDRHDEGAARPNMSDGP